ncbi:MAG: hypothetical protein KDK37_19145, partial [Leptospiraceae bacterium]|nr:hypothetical protein [Leptospiraceae bacterium]
YMNASEIKTALQKLAQQELELLSDKQLATLDKGLRTAEQSIEKEKLWKTVQNLHNKGVAGNAAVFERFKKARGLQKPKKSASLKEVNSYIKEMESLMQEFKKEYDRERQKLAEIVRRPPEEAAATLASLPPDRRTIMSEVAGLTKRTAKGSATLKLSDKPSANLKWLKEYQKQKSLNTILDG